MFGMRIIFVLLFSIIILVDGKRKFKILINSGVKVHLNQKCLRLIVFFSPAFGFSHLSFNGRLADLLVDAGHEVHLYIPNWEASETRNGSKKAHKVVCFMPKNMEFDLDKNSQLTHPFEPEDPRASAQVWDNFKQITLQQCKDQLADPNYTEGIRNGNFDVGISEMHDSCAFFHFHNAKIPTTIMSAAMVTPDIISLAWGLPLPRSYVAPWLLPSVNVPYLTYKDRLLNIIMDTIVFSQLVEHQNVISREFTKRYGQPMPTYTEVLKQVKYIFVNMPEVLEHPRPITHKFKSIGGIHLNPPSKTMSPELKSIFDNAKLGVVLFSYGSNIDMDKMPKQMKKNVLESFAKFPDYSFIWKIKPNEETKELIKDYKNVYTFEWLDQITILADKRTKLFITHSGLNSIIESAWYGVPSLVQPFFNDQYLNAALLLNRKTALHVDKHNLNVENFSDAIRRLLTDKSFKANAQKLSEKLQNNPVNVSEMFVKHIEYAASFESNFEMNVPDLDFMTYYNLDIYLPFLLILFIVIYTIYWFVKRFVRFLFYVIFEKKNKVE